MMRHRRERQEELGEDTDLAGIGLHTAREDNSYSNNSSKVCLLENQKNDGNLDNRGNCLDIPLYLVLHRECMGVQCFPSSGEAT